MGKASSIKDRQNVLAVKSIKTMPRKAIEKKKKLKRHLQRDLFYRHGLLVIFFFPSSLSKHRKFTEWGLELVPDNTLVVKAAPSSPKFLTKLFSCF